MLLVRTQALLEKKTKWATDGGDEKRKAEEGNITKRTMNEVTGREEEEADGEMMDEETIITQGTTIEDIVTKIMMMLTTSDKTEEAGETTKTGGGIFPTITKRTEEEE